MSLRGLVRSGTSARDTNTPHAILRHRCKQHRISHLVSNTSGAEEAWGTQVGQPFLSRPMVCVSMMDKPFCRASETCLDWCLLPLQHTLSFGGLARAPLPANPTDVRGVDQGDIILGELLPSASVTSAATEADGDAGKKRLLWLSGFPALSLASQADAMIAAGNDDDHDAGLRPRLTGEGEYLAAAGDLHLFCEFATVSTPGLPLAAVVDCPTHLSVMIWREKQMEGGMEMDS